MAKNKWIETITDGTEIITPGAAPYDKGKGNYDIAINKAGDKTVVVSRAGANDTVYTTGISPEDADKLNVKLPTGSGTIYTFTKKDQDLTITATLNDTKKTTESITIQNYFDFKLRYPYIVQPEEIAADFDREKVYFNEANIEEMFVNGQVVTIGGVKVSQIMEDLGYTQELKNKKIKVPTAITKANAFLGTKYDDSFSGTTGNDAMLTLGGINTFTTGKKGKTAIASLHDGKDTYDITSFEAGTVIYDENDDYTLTAHGVDTNNLHIIKSDIREDLSDFGGYTVDNFKYLTDSKGITNLSKIDLQKLGPSLKELKDANITTKQDLLNHPDAVNNILKMFPGIISKFRGVTVATAEDAEFKDITVYSKKAKKNENPEQIISAESQAKIHGYTSTQLYGYLNDVSAKFHIDVTTKENIAQFLFLPSLAEFEVDGALITDEKFKKQYYTLNQNTGKYQLNKKAYNEIKNGFFNLYQPLYVGTSGDNSYTFTNKNDFNGAVAAGLGNDTFTFKNIISKDAAKTLQFNVDSSLISETGETFADTFVFKNNSLEKGTLDMEVRFDESDEHVISGVDFTALDLKKDTSANVTYNIGEGDEPEGFNFEENGPFSLTIKDKNRTYELSAEYNYNEETDFSYIVYDWNAKPENKKSHMAYTFADNTKIVGNKGINTLFSDTLGGAESTLIYESKGGKDFVVSKGSSDGTYTAKLTSKSNFFLYDDNGDDKMLLDNTKKDLGKARLFFNVSSDGSIVPTEVPEGSELEDYAEITLFYGKLSKSSFVVDSEIIDDETVYDVNTKSGIVCNAKDIETFKCKDGNINMDAAIYEVTTAVKDWLGTHTGYDCAADVIGKGDKNDIKSLMEVYNSVDLGQYVGMA